MKDYKSLTDEALLNELDKLLTGLEIDEAMDGSGECGELIYRSYEKYFDAIYAEMDRRGLYESQEEEYYPEVPF